MSDSIISPRDGDTSQEEEFDFILSELPALQV